MEDKQKIDKAIELFQVQKFDLALSVLNTIPNNKKELIHKKQVIQAAIYSRSGKYQDALDLIDSIESHKKDAETISIRGITLRSMGKLKEALGVLMIGSEQYPESFDIAHNLAVTATDLGQFQLAIEKSNLVEKLNPNFLETYKNLGRIYITIRDSKKGRETFSKLEKLVGNDADVLIGKGACELIDNNYEIAAEYFRKAIAINEKYGSAWGNLGLCLKLMGDYEQAQNCLEKACQVDPKQVEHPWNLALIQLARGNLKDGWKNYEIRFDPRRIATDRVVMPQTPVPMLNNSNNIKGKTIVLLQEQGYGDALQFYRYAKELKEEGARKIYAIVSKELIHAVRTIPWLDEVRYELTSTQELPDYWVYPMSLPNRYQQQYNQAVPAPVPYIFPMKEKIESWSQKITKSNKKLRIALLWAGRETHTNDKNRSISLGQLEPLAQFSDQVDFISIQKGKKALEVSNYDWIGQDVGSEITDFSDTAGLFANIDLLISVDSAPVHLAGAMGMPVWALIPFAFDFRWMVDREDSPWYPNTMRLFRQRKGENWQPVIERLIKELKQVVEQKPPRWTAKIVDISPQRLNTYAAGLNLYLQSAYDFHTQGKLFEAYSNYQLVLQYDPNNIDALRNLAAIFRSQGALTQAQEIYEYAIQKGFCDPVLYGNYSNLLLQQENYTYGVQMAQKAIELGSQELRPWLVWAQCAHQLGNTQNALEIIKQSMSQHNHPDQWMRLITYKIELHDTQGSRDLLARFKETQGETLEFNLLAAEVHRSLGEYSKALDHYEKAIAKNPNYYETYMNRGVLMAYMNQYDKAIEDTKKSIQLNPNNVEAIFNLGLYQLTLGNFAEGWANYEYRMDSRRTATERVKLPSMKMPRWKGEPLNQKTILLMPEQGYGDYIQFIRYAQWLKSLGAHVIAATTKPLEELFRSCPWIDHVAVDGEAVRYDYWVFPMSLPYLANTSLGAIPKEVPYLFAPEYKMQSWKEWLLDKKLGIQKPLIALCWQGAKVHKHDKNRSIDPSQFLPILDSQKYDVVAIIKDEKQADTYQIGDHHVVNAGVAIQSFVDTAAILTHTRCLISVDSAPIHLAGAMNIKAAVLIDSFADFRWLLNRKDSPWYPSIEIYRKGNNPSWQSAINAIKNDLNHL